MILFVFCVLIVLGVWAVCSLAEASIYAVPMPYVRQLEQSESEAGRILTKFKLNMERPISAILIVNTVVAAAGASIAGAQAAATFGEANLLWFSILFTIGALFFSEIAPKIAGIAYHRSIAVALAKPLSIVVFLLYPLIWLIERMSGLIMPRVPIAMAPEDEVQQLAAISAEEGSIMPYEADLVRNVLALDQVTAGEIMTPVSVVETLPEQLTLGELAKCTREWHFSRIPLHKKKDPGLWSGFVLSRDVLAAMASDQFEIKLLELAKPLNFVSESAPGHKLLKAFLARRTHIFGVAGASGTIVRVVTLEDVLESLIGAEIVDESDAVVDMRTLAQIREQST